MNIIVILFAVTAVISGFLTRAVRDLALRFGVVDTPDHRKVHKQPIPRMGGLAIFLAFSAGLLVTAVPGFGSPIAEVSLQKVAALLVPAGVMVLVGLLDDIVNLKPLHKLFGQVLAAGMAVYFGAGVTGLSFLPGVVLPSVVDVIFTVGWLVFVANAVNLMDGLDGLAGGVSFITLCTLIITAVVTGKTELIIPAGLLASAIIGFLFFNFHPATIFLGDTGSLFLGFTIALLALDNSFVGAASFSFFAPFLMLGLPISDTVLTIVRRLESGKIPKVSAGRVRSGIRARLKKLMQADKLHMHHRFIALGQSHGSTVIIMYGIALLFCLLGFTSILLNDRTVFYILAANMIALVIGFSRLGYITSSFTGNSHFVRRYLATHAAPHSFFQGIIDLLVVVLSFSLAFMLRYDYYLPPFHYEVFTRLLALVMVIKMGFFYLTRLYSKHWRIMQGEDMFRVIRSNGLASLAAYVIISSGVLRNDLAVGVLVLDFFICAFLLIGIRVGYQLYLDRYGHETTHLNNALLYGVTPKSAATFFSKELLREYGLNPVGLIEAEGQERKLRGRKYDGLPVFRGDVDISEAIEKYHIEVLLVDERLLGLDAGLLQRLKQRLPALRIEPYAISFQDPVSRVKTPATAEITHA